MSELLELSLADYVGLRLDVALTQAWPNLSRVQWQKLLQEDAVTIEGMTPKASLRLTGQEIALITLPELMESELIAENIPLDIRYEDSDLLVVNKAAGMVVHPSLGTETGTLVNAVLFHCPDIAGIGGEKRPGVVHRLDKETSGLIVLAKNDATLRSLQEQFQQRTVHKAYLALLEGAVHPEKAMIDAAIGRDMKDRKRMAVIAIGSSATSRPAQTTYKLVQSYQGYSLVRCLLHTGRTHQIRVHMAYIGHPLVGDRLYGHRKQRLGLKRQFLHSAELGFTHPTTQERLNFESDLPTDLQAILDELIARSNL